MNNSSNHKQLTIHFVEKAIPQSRFGRMSKLGSLLASVTGNLVKNSLTSVARNEKPNINNTLLNINNAQTLAKHLSHMRGAAMKVGQMLSMDAGDILPKEWEPILSVLREQAYVMPKSQLLYMLSRNFGQSWSENFSYFSYEPIAAASIGQVHRAVLKSGEEVAIKIQYPGVAKSIESDIDNLAAILKFTGLIPQGLDISALLEQAKEQLKLETNYGVELEYLTRYRDKLKNDGRFLIPQVYNHLSTNEILCMEYIDALPIANLIHEESAFKSLMVNNLFDILFKELFEHRLVQSDPNFANFMYQKQSGKLVLLDFGACKDISLKTQTGFLAMAQSMQRLDGEELLTSLLNLGLLDCNTPQTVKTTVVEACLMAAECLQAERYNFKQTDIIKRLQNHTKGLIANKNAIASPDFEVALINRKVTGTVLLANKMNVEVSLKKRLNNYLS